MLPGIYKRYMRRRHLAEEGESMAIKFSCPHCGKQYTVLDHLAGRRARCSSCNREMAVPSRMTQGPDVSPVPPPIPVAARSRIPPAVLPTNEGRRFSMKSTAKWIAIGWSIFCLFGILSGMANVGKEFDRPMNEAERAGANIGVGCGMAMWVGIWAAIAGPAFLIYVLSESKEVANAPSGVQRSSVLCRECGKYYEGPTNFCPHCGKPTWAA
jgi:hypothetical protein